MYNLIAKFLKTFNCQIKIKSNDTVQLLIDKEMLCNHNAELLNNAFLLSVHNMHP